LFGLACVNRVCANVGGCTSDDECPINQACVFGGCYFFDEYECDRDVDCADDEECNFGDCESLFSGG
jgi:hypothetical protein